MVRVVRPGGKVAAQDVEMHTMMLGPMPDDLLIALKGHCRTAKPESRDMSTGSPATSYAATSTPPVCAKFAAICECVNTSTH